MPHIELSSGVQLFHTVQYSDTASPQNYDLTVLLLHGLGSSHAFYEPSVPSLLKSSRPIRIVGIDTEGSGLSALGEESAASVKSGGFGTQSIKNIGLQAFEVISKLSGPDSSEKVVVVGHSMGGITACEMAVHGSWSSGGSNKSVQVLGAVLIGPVVPSPQIEKVFEERIVTVRKGGMLPMADTIPSRATGSKSSALHRGFIRALLCGQDPSGYISLCNSIATATVPAYKTLSGGPSVLIIAGEEDQSAPLSGCQHIQNEIGRNCRLEVLQGIGHWHCIEASENVGKLVEEFVQLI